MNTNGQPAEWWLPALITTHPVQFGKVPATCMENAPPATSPSLCTQPGLSVTALCLLFYNVVHPDHSSPCFLKFRLSKPGCRGCGRSLREDHVPERGQVDGICCCLPGGARGVTWLCCRSRKMRCVQRCSRCYSASRENKSQTPAGGKGRAHPLPNTLVF